MRSEMFNNNLKKRRVGKACDACRMKKTKCDGHRPCTKCRLDNKLCIYTEKKPKMERTFSSSYVELLQGRVDLLQSSLRSLLGHIANGDELTQYLPTDDDFSINDLATKLLGDDYMVDGDSRLAAKDMNDTASVHSEHSDHSHSERSDLNSLQSESLSLQSDDTLNRQHSLQSTTSNSSQNSQISHSSQLTYPYSHRPASLNSVTTEGSPVSVNSPEMSSLNSFVPMSRLPVLSDTIKPRLSYEQEALPVDSELALNFDEPVVDFGAPLEVGFDQPFVKMEELDGFW